MITSNADTRPNQNLKLSAKLAPQTQLMPLAFEEQCKSFFAGNMKRLVNLAGSEEEARTIMLTAMNAVSKQTFTMEAVSEDFAGFARCILTSCELRLYPGAMQECAYVPMKNGKTSKREFQFWPMYQGLVKLMYQSGLVRSISCEVVYEADSIEYQLGTQKFLRHVPFLGDREDRGERKMVYACIETAHGTHIEIVPMRKIESIRNKSPGGKSDYSPWNLSDPENYDAMAKKTALKQASKWVPKSYRLMQAIEIDNEHTPDKLNFFGGKDLGALLEAPKTPVVSELATNKEGTPPT